jgi:hypothetical protein
MLSLKIAFAPMVTPELPNANIWNRMIVERASALDHMNN